LLEESGNEEQNINRVWGLGSEVANHANIKLPKQTQNSRANDLQTFQSKHKLPKQTQLPKQAQLPKQTQLPKASAKYDFQQPFTTSRSAPDLYFSKAR
jgi:hypothetical protein